MTDRKLLMPTVKLAKKKNTQFPNESEDHRQARNAQLAEEVELRRHIRRVGKMRRALPPGAEVTKDDRFEGANGEVALIKLFGDHDTLVIYSMMYGPQRKKGCPTCTSQLSA